MICTTRSLRFWSASKLYKHKCDLLKVIVNLYREIRQIIWGIPDLKLGHFNWKHSGCRLGAFVLLPQIITVEYKNLFTQICVCLSF